MLTANSKESIPAPGCRGFSVILYLFALAFAALMVVRPRLATGDDSLRKRAAERESVEPGWPQFRGPNGQGEAVAADLPLTWSETDNVLWKTYVFGAGWSSPVISGDDLWLTTTTEGGKGVRALRFDCRTGEIVVRTKPLFD